MLTTQKDLINKLSELRKLEPDPAFSARGRALIFMNEARPNRQFAWLTWAGALAVVIAMTLALSYGFLSSPKPALSASLNPDKLSQEFNNLSINIELKDISYHQNVNQAIASALTEISSNQAKHLNPDVLQSEAQNLNLNAGTNPQIDELLKNIIF